MPRILSLDVASTTGFAFGGPDGPPLSGQFECYGVDAGEQFLGFEDWLLRQIDRLQPDTLVFESPSTHQTNHRTARKLYGLIGLVEKIGARAQLDVFEEGAATIRSHFLGPYRIPRGEVKAAVMRRCDQLGLDYHGSHDEADALALLDFAQHKLRAAAITERFSLTPARS